MDGANALDRLGPRACCRGLLLRVHRLEPSGASENPYCERCKIWAEQEWTSDYLDDEPMADVDAFRSLVDREPMATLTALKRTQRISPGTQAFLKVQSCSECQDFNSLDVILETVTWDAISTHDEEPGGPEVERFSLMMRMNQVRPSRQIRSSTIYWWTAPHLSCSRRCFHSRRVKCLMHHYGMVRVS